MAKVILKNAKITKITPESNIATVTNSGTSFMGMTTRGERYLIPFMEAIDPALMGQAVPDGEYEFKEQHWLGEGNVQLSAKWLVL